MQIARILVCCLVPCLLQSISCAGDEKAHVDSIATGSVHAVDSSKLLSPTPLDLRWISIPADFRASDPEAVMKRLTFSHADQFESSKTFAQRTAATADTSPVAFALPDSIIFYDADSAIFHVSLGTSPVSLKDDAWEAGSLDTERGVEVRDEHTKTGEYSGQNAFGVEKKVSKFNVDIVLVAPPLRSLGFGLGVSLHVPADSARQITPNLRPLLVFTPHALEGYFVNGSRAHTKPTISNPTDYARRTRTLFGSGISVWIYDKETRRILLKKKLPESRVPLE